MFEANGGKKYSNQLKGTVFEKKIKPFWTDFQLGEAKKIIPCGPYEYVRSPKVQRILNPIPEELRDELALSA